MRLHPEPFLLKNEAEVRVLDRVLRLREDLIVGALQRRVPRFRDPKMVARTERLKSELEIVKRLRSHLLEIE